MIGTMNSLHPPVPTDTRGPRPLSHRWTHVFVILLLLLAVASAGLAVRSALRIHSDPELKQQLDDVHDRASRREPPSPRTDP